MCHKDGTEMSIRETRTDLHVSTKAEWRRYVLDNRVKKPMKRIKPLKAINRRQQELATATRRRTAEDGRMIINNKLKYRWRRRKLKRENSWRCHQAWVDKHALKKIFFEARTKLESSYKHRWTNRVEVANITGDFPDDQFLPVRRCADTLATGFEAMKYFDDLSFGLACRSQQKGRVFPRRKGSSPYPRLFILFKVEPMCLLHYFFTFQLCSRALSLKHLPVCPM